MTQRIHLIGICGTAMATLAALLKRRGLRRARLGSERLPADERLPGRRGHPTHRAATRAEHIAARPRPRRRRQRHLARQSRSSKRCSSGRSGYCSLPEADSRSFPVGRPVDRHRRHARQDDDDVADRVAADARQAATRRCSSAASRCNFGDGGSSYRVGRGRDFVIEGDEYDSAFFDKTAKFLKYLPDIAVDQQRRVRPRRHLRRTSTPCCWRSAGWSTWSRAAACCCSAPTARTRAALASAPSVPVETFGTRRGRRLAGDGHRHPPMA